MRSCIIVGAALALAPAVQAAEITISCGSQELEVRLCEAAAADWAVTSGHTVNVVSGAERSNERYFEYLNELSEESDEIDVYQIDVIWPSALAPHLLDLSEFIPEEELAQYSEAIIANNTVDGKLLALPWFTDVGLLYYREDLLEKYGLEVPETWGELVDAAVTIQEGERDAGNDEMWGYVFQGQAYEGLTVNALEWIVSFGGEGIVDDEGAIAVDDPRAALALAQAASWVGTIAPPRVTQFVEEDARITFQLGNAAFMRNWPYAWSLLNAEDSAVAGKVGVAPLPSGGSSGSHAAALGGWNLAVSRYSDEPQVAVEFVRYLAGPEEQKRRAIEGSFAPTILDLYEDPEVLDANPFFAEVAEALPDAIARPSANTGVHYSNVSAQFWNAVHDTLNREVAATDALAALDDRLTLLQRRAGW